MIQESLIKFLAQQCGIQNIPKTQKEFLNTFLENSQFSGDLKKAEQEGILKRADDGTLSVIDADKLKSLAMNFISKTF